MASEVARGLGIYIVDYIIFFFFFYRGLGLTPGVFKSGRIRNKKAGSKIKPIIR